MAKFKEGSVVTLTVSGYKASRYTIGVVIDYIAKDRLSVDFGKAGGVIAIKECDLALIGESAFKKDEIFEKIHDSTFLRTIKTVDDLVKGLNLETSPPIVSPVKDAFTDPNVDYEALSEEPVYYEFIDIGKALNKLKKYEHLDCKPSDSEEVIYIVNKKYPKAAFPHLVLKKEYNGRDLVKYVVKNQANSQVDIRPIDKSIAIFTNLKEALAYVELLNKIDESEETPF